MGSLGQGERQCYVTLITKPSYLPGAIILAHSLDKHGSQFPLIVQYTSSLGEEAVVALKAEGQRSGRIIPSEVELLLPPKGRENVGSVAERFADTYTKLRCFQLYELGYTKVCFLDADMAVFQNPDTIFDQPLPRKDWLGANHVCVCGIDPCDWQASDWNIGNCAYTALDAPDQVMEPIKPESRPTHRLLNSGMLLFYPSQELWNDMIHTFNTSEKIKHYQFPDQDFLADYFRDKWLPVSWKYNAIKTMRYIHPTMWSDDEVVVLHYIVDKPWERLVSPEGIAGHMGRDGVTHSWWWDVYREWLAIQRGIDPVVLQTMGKLVGKDQPFTEHVPLPKKPGTPADVTPYPPTKTTT